MRKKRLGFSSVLAGAMLAVLIWAPGSQAGVVTVGTPLPMKVAESFVIGCGGCVMTNPAVPGGAADVSPVDGVILRWRLYRGDVAIPGFADPGYRLRVLTPLGGSFLAAGTSSKSVPARGGTLETFPTSLPVKAGQLIGLEAENGDSAVRFGFSAAASSVFLEPVPVDGETATDAPDWEEGYLFPFNADVLPPPRIDRVSPGGASLERTTTATIAGDNFAEVSGVSVDGRPVPYTLDSMTQLSVTVPPRWQLGSVPVTVTTVAGSATGIFNYEGCVVPKLKGKSLIAGRKALSRRLCKLGEVRTRHGATARTGRVKRQSRRPGAVLPAATKVEVVLGLNPKPRP
jgi:hypothetical protein